MNPNSEHKTLVLLTGPTAVGKTETSIRLAQQLQTEIVSADARQFYRETVVGTAAPSPCELSLAKHHLVGHLSIHDYYNVSMFEQQALQALEKIFAKSDYALLTGGSGLYLDTLCSGIDTMPDIDPDIRTRVKKHFSEHGLEGLRTILQEVDPEYYHTADIHNPNRMMRAVEVFWSTGQKYSLLRKKKLASRPFRIKRLIVNRPRHVLHQRIAQRTRLMVEQGIIEEAISLFPHRHLNALNTVGYKELFDWMGNHCDLHTAIEKIEIHTRQYAKRQITWFKKYDDAQWFLPGEINAMLRFIQS